MTEEEIIARGKEYFVKCYSGIVPLPEDISPKSFGELNMKIFNEVWGEDALSFRDKRLLVLGLLAGKGSDSALFTIHARSALRNKEISAAELRAAISVMLYYAGAPNATAYFISLEKLLAETNNGDTA